MSRTRHSRHLKEMREELNQSGCFLVDSRNMLRKVVELSPCGLFRLVSMTHSPSVEAIHRERRLSLLSQYSLEDLSPIFNGLVCDIGSEKKLTHGNAEGL